jgi:hypothetical protein
MILTRAQRNAVLLAGGSLVISGSQLTLPQLREMAAAVAKSTGTITIKNVGYVSAAQLKQLAALAPGKLIFDISDQL